MILFVLILGMILVRGAEIADSNNFSKNYMSIAGTNLIKGVFVLLVLLGHAVTYVKMSGALDQTYITLKEHLHQMVVSVFWIWYDEVHFKKRIRLYKTDSSQTFFHFTFEF